MILDALLSDEETFFGANVSDDEGIDSTSCVAISPDQDETSGYGSLVQEPPEVVTAAVVAQPDVDVTEEEISAEKRLAGGMTAARRDYPGEASHAILLT